MRLKNFALALLVATALTGCNDALDSSGIDLKSVRNKTEHPLSAKIVADMQAKNMPRNSPIMIRIFKEEGKLEIWKAKADNRFDLIKSYDICAWSGKLGPKIKEGDRQAPEGFYHLTPAHLNPNSKYFLAINTGFPNRYDQANGRTGSNLMIHGACSSSGCYSMTDEQVLEIYAFARDAFRGGQTAVQMQAYPFRMTAENMARHRDSQHTNFWKMIKVGYDHFDVTRRPPEVAVCDKKYVFNQQADGGSFNPVAACPPSITAPALAMAMASHSKAYEGAYKAALEKFEGKVWYEPTEAERKAIVADKRKGKDLAYAPTGTSIDAGKLMSQAEFKEMMEARMSGSRARPTTTTVLASVAPTGRATSAAERMKQDRLPATAPVTTSTASIAAPVLKMADGRSVSVPVPATNPLAYAAVPPKEEKKPFWKFWGAQ